MKTSFKTIYWGLLGVTLLGLSVRADDERPTGPTVHVSVSATDTSGGTLHYRWKSTDGSIQNVNSPNTTWTLPVGKGLHFAYVLVSNGKGGYTERRISVSTDGERSARGGGEEDSHASTLRPPSAPAQVNDFYRGFVSVGETVDTANQPGIDIYTPGAQVFLQDPSTLARYPPIGFVTTNPRGEYVIPGVPPGVQGMLTTATTMYGDGNDGGFNGALTGSVRLADGTGTDDSSVCGTVDEFFGVHDYPTVTLLDATNTPLGDPVSLNEFGDFNIAVDPRTATALVRCDDSTVSVMLSPATINFVLQFNEVDLGLIPVLGVTPPTVVSMAATLDGNSVGKLLPPPTGFPSDVLKRSDGYLAEKGIDTMIGACQYYKAIGGVQSCDSHGNPMGAKLTYDQWQRMEGIGPYARVGTPQYKALYINKVDLNLTRDHTSISYSPNQTAAVVCNHLGPPATTPAQLMNPSATDIETAIGNTKNGKNEVACVAMDYRAWPGVNDGKPFVRFFIFGPNGTLLPSINLDGRAEKFVPGTCIACHGGDHYAGKFPEDGSGPANVGGHFLPYDAGNFEFSQTQPGLTELEQREQIYHLNLNVLNAGPTLAEQELITGWYQNDPLVCPTANRQCHVLDTSYLPDSWSTANITAAETANNDTLQPADIANLQSFYRNVIARSCRTCHVAMIESYNFDHYAANALVPFGQNALLGDIPFDMKRNVCGRAYSNEDTNFNAFQRFYTMPNSLVTFNRFYLSENSTYGAVDQTALFNIYQALDGNGPCFAPGY